MDTIVQWKFYSLQVGEVPFCVAQGGGGPQRGLIVHRDPNLCNTSGLLFKGYRVGLWSLRVLFWLLIYLLVSWVQVNPGSRFTP